MAEVSTKTLENPALSGTGTGTVAATVAGAEIDIREIAKTVAANTNRMQGFEKDLNLQKDIHNLDIKTEEKFQDIRDDIHNLDMKTEGNFNTLDKKIDANAHEAREAIAKLDKKIDNNFHETKEVIAKLDKKIDANANESKEDVAKLDKKIDANAHEAKEAIAKLDKKIDDNTNKYLIKIYRLLVIGLWTAFTGGIGFALHQSGVLKSIFTSIFGS